MELVVQRKGHMMYNGTPGDAVMAARNCLGEGELGDGKVLSNTVQTPASWSAPLSYPADCAQGEAMQRQHFAFRWHMLEMTEPAYMMLHQGV